MICEVKNKTDTNADIYFYGDIVSGNSEKYSNDDMCPQDIVEILNNVKGVQHIDLYINSGGGSVFAGNAIYNKIKKCGASVTTHIDGLAASIASVIAFAGDTIEMPENTFMMIHKAWDIVIGNSDDLRTAADRLDIIEQTIVDVYTQHLNDGWTEDDIKQMMSDETWLSAKDAAALFDCVDVCAPDKKKAQCVTNYTYKNIPPQIAINPTTDEKKEEEKPAVKKTAKKKKNESTIEINDSEQINNDIAIKAIENFIMKEEDSNND